MIWNRNRSQRATEPTSDADSAAGGLPTFASPIISTAANKATTVNAAAIRRVQSPATGGWTTSGFSTSGFLRSGIRFFAIRWRNVGDRKFRGHLSPIVFSVQDHTGPLFAGPLFAG